LSGQLLILGLIAAQAATLLLPAGVLAPIRVREGICDQKKISDPRTLATIRRWVGVSPAGVRREIVLLLDDSRRRTSYTESISARTNADRLIMYSVVLHQAEGRNGGFRQIDTLLRSGGTFQIQQQPQPQNGRGASTPVGTPQRQGTGIRPVGLTQAERSLLAQRIAELRRVCSDSVP
jgi:hypothetical protein